MSVTFGTHTIDAAVLEVLIIARTKFNARVVIPNITIVTAHGLVLP